MRLLFAVENTENKGDEEYLSAFRSMPEERRARCENYRFENDRRLCAFAYSVLCRLLTEAGLPREKFVFERDDNDKPFLKGKELFFSVSHSGTYVAAAVSDGEIGIDIEAVKPVSASVIKRVCAPAELSFVAGESEPEGKVTDKSVLERFFMVWTFREAYGKYTGKGLSENCVPEFCPGRKNTFVSGNCICSVYTGEE